MENISLAISLRLMDNVTVSGCFFETLDADAKILDEAADYLEGLCSEEGHFARVADYLGLRSFFIDCISSIVTKKLRISK